MLLSNKIFFILIFFHLFFLKYFSSRAGLRLPYVLSPSPTRRTFATRRSMSPIAMRPSSLGPVKRRFDTDDNYTNMYSPPSKKKLTSET